MKRYLILAATLIALASTADAQTMAPNGTYIGR